MRSAEETCRLATDRLLYSPYDSVQDFADPELLRRLPRLLRLLFEPMDRFINRHTSDPRVQKILGYPAVFLGTSPKAAPSLYHLMSHLDINQSVLYPRGGFSAVVEAVARVAREHGADLSTGCRVTEILTEGRRAAGVRFTTADGEQHRLDADIVVSSADIHHTETALLAPHFRTRTRASWQRRAPGPARSWRCWGLRVSCRNLPIIPCSSRRTGREGSRRSKEGSCLRPASVPLRLQAKRHGRGRPSGA